MEPIITWKDFQKTMPWEIVILVGGGYALASGSKVALALCSFLTGYFSSYLANHSGSGQEDSRELTTRCSPMSLGREAVQPGTDTLSPLALLS